MARPRKEKNGHRGALRALDVLAALNEHNGATVMELARATRIPRPSLYRILSVMRTAGYVTRRDDDRFFLTPLVRIFSDGYSDVPWVLDVARPVLQRLRNEVVWRTDLLAFHEPAMLILLSTRDASPWTIDTVAVGHRLPVCATASGLVWLAYSRAETQAALIEFLAKSDSPYERAARHAPSLRHLLEKVRKQGYATRPKGFMDRHDSIAVPVIADGQIRACIAITFISSVLKPEEAAARYFKSLQRAAGEIAAGYAALGKQL